MVWNGLKFDRVTHRRRSIPYCRRLDSTQCAENDVVARRVFVRLHFAVYILSSVTRKHKQLVYSSFFFSLLNEKIIKYNYLLLQNTNTSTSDTKRNNSKERQWGTNEREWPTEQWMMRAKNKTLKMEIQTKYFCKFYRVAIAICCALWRWRQTADGAACMISYIRIKNDCDKGESTFLFFHSFLWYVLVGVESERFLIFHNLFIVLVHFNATAICLHFNGNTYMHSRNTVSVRILKACVQIKTRKLAWHSVEAKTTNTRFSRIKTIHSHLSMCKIIAQKHNGSRNPFVLQKHYLWSNFQLFQFVFRVCAS